MAQDARHRPLSESAIDLVIGEIIAVYVPAPELGCLVYYRVLADRLDGPYQDDACTVPLDVRDE